MVDISSIFWWVDWIKQKEISRGIKWPKRLHDAMWCRRSCKQVLSTSPVLITHSEDETMSLFCCSTQIYALTRSKEAPRAVVSAGKGSRLLKELTKSAWSVVSLAALRLAPSVWWIPAPSQAVCTSLNGARRITQASARTATERNTFICFSFQFEVFTCSPSSVRFRFFPGTRKLLLFRATRDVTVPESWNSMILDAQFNVS